MKIFVLIFSSFAGLSEKADILLKKRASNQSVDDNGATPLHYAVYNNHAVSSNYNVITLMWNVSDTMMIEF